MEDVRHWWIQVSDTCNMTPEVGGAVFQEHAPTISLKGFRWVKAYSAEDIVKKIGMTPRRWAEINHDLGQARAQITTLTKSLENAIEERDETVSTYRGTIKRLEKQLDLAKGALKGALSLIEMCEYDGEPLRETNYKFLEDAIAALESKPSPDAGREEC